MVQGKKMANPDEILDQNTSFERSLSKLSENHKMFDIGLTVLKYGCSTTTPLPPPSKVMAV